MIKWLSQRIADIARQLEYDHFTGSEKRAFLKEELSKLVIMRDKYNEFKKTEKEEEMAKHKW